MKKYTLDQLRGAWGAGFGMGLKRKDESLKIETQPNSREGLIKPEEVPPPAGLIWIVAAPVPRHGFYFRVKKRPRRTEPIDPELERKILFLFAARAKTRNVSYF